MHGIIHLQLKKFLESVTNSETIKTIYEDAGQFGKFFDATKYHPDEALVSILTSACKHLNLDRDTALEAFGKYIAPSLMITYKSYIKPEWKCLDLLENMETTIHKTVRAASPGAEPPRLAISRITPKEVRIDYTSPRKMISLGIGIVKTIAEHYQEKISIIRSTIPDGTRLVIQKS